VRGILYGRNYRDLSVLAQDKVCFAGERVAAVAAEDRQATEEALDLIQVDYEELPTVFDPLEALEESAPIIHPDVNSYPGLPEKLDKPSNAYVHDLHEKGDIDAGFAQSDIIVENTFTVPRVHQAFIEPHCCLVWIDDQERVQIWSSSKAPHGVKKSMSRHRR
jgi:carbon-monoxide dehydrogenase large subunit